MGVLTLLQAKKFLPAEQLAQNFEVSIRTVYRDLTSSPFSKRGIP
jgi:predicted DNA-binding transcriptional regulator YafY